MKLHTKNTFNQGGFKMDPDVIMAIAAAAEREGGLSNINMVGKAETWHQCVVRSGTNKVMMYNDNEHFTKGVRIK